MSTPASPGLPYHPLANMFPLIEGEAFSGFADDILVRGMLEEIVVLDGQILDGRNRYRAAVQIGLIAPDQDWRNTPGFVDFADLRTQLTPFEWVVSKNLHRRHLSESQRAMMAAQVANKPAGRPSTAADENPASLPLISQAQAAEQLSVSPRSLRTAKAVLEDGAAELVQAVTRGDVTIASAADIASLPIERQRELIAAVDRKALSAVIKDVRAERQAEKRERREFRERELGQRQAALPDRKYGVIYADPEWRFEPYSRGTGMDRAADNHYPTTPTSDLVLRPVGQLAATDCVLWLWATAPMLLSALRCMQNWGFEYKTHIVWVKDRISTGYWARNKHELLLIGTRGHVPAPAEGDQSPSVINALVGAHSEKPVEFAELIERLFPTLPKIELNARVARPGWDRWGLEAPAESAA